MELLCIILLLLFLYLTGQFFSYLKNQEISHKKIDPKEFWNQQHIKLQSIINEKKEKLKNTVKTVQSWKPIDLSIIDTWQKSFDDDIESQPWRKFEREVAEMFYDRGFNVILGPGKNDNGIDIEITKGFEVYVIQCKHYYGRKMVTANEVRDFQGAIDLYKNQKNKNARGIFITSGKSSSKAKETAKILNIELWDKHNWRNNIISL